MTCAMPDGLMTVRVEAWMLAADEDGIHLLNGRLPDGKWGSWLSDPIAALSDMHSEVEYLAWNHGFPKQDLLALHSTSAEEPGAWSSWHADQTSAVHTYMVAARVPERSYVPEFWPDAQPVTPALFEICGRPEAYRPVDAPIPRDSAILFHGVRHLEHLYLTDHVHAEALGVNWGRALGEFTPILATMYHRKPEPVG